MVATCPVILGAAPREGRPSASRVRPAAPEARPVDRPYVWVVPSESRPGEEHQVDLSHLSGNGECSCPDFTMTVAEVLRVGEGEGLDTRCKHIKGALCSLATAMVHQQMQEDRRAFGFDHEKAGSADWPLKPGWKSQTPRGSRPISHFPPPEA